MYHYTECGLPNVWLVNGYTWHETPYGRGVSIHDIDGLHRAIANELVHHKPRLTGAEFRFLRTELELSQARLAEWLGVDAQAVARWEKGKTRLPKWADRIMRALYREIHDGNAHLKEIVERLNDMDEREHGRACFEETSQGWKSAA